MIKIQIKSIYGSALFEYEKENNTLKGTVIEAVKNGAYLTGADLTGADLTGADLTGADLTGADLTGADGEKIVIKKAVVFTGLYKYLVIPIISEDNSELVKMGCYTRTVEAWEKDFWNNLNEFLDHDSEESKLRVFAFETAKIWLKLNR